MEDLFSRVLTLTSFITHRFIQFIEELVLRDLSRFLEEWAIKSNGRHPSNSSNPNYVSVSCSSSSSTNCNSNESSGIHDRRASVLEYQSLVNSSLEIVHRRYNYEGVHFIFKGLTLPISCLQFVGQLSLASWRCCLCYLRRAQAQAQSVVCRVCKTLHGSSDEIGWLQRAPGMAPVKDGSARFRELLQCIRNGEHILPDSFVYLLIPGLFSNHGPLYFVRTKRFFSKMGLACHVAKIHSEASVEQNASELKQYIEELYWGSGKRVMLLGHSKGGVDAAAALSIYSHELKDIVGGLALVQSPYGGTPIASDILRDGQVADTETRKVMEFIICRLIKGDIRSLEDLTYEKRKEFILNNKLPDNIPLISFHSEANIAPGVIATMSPIAHAELPWLPFPRFGNNDSESAVLAGRKFPVIVPVSAAMALCALHLRLRYGEKSDGLVTCRDAEVPGSVVVKPDQKLDHAWMVYSSWNRDLSEPDASDMCEALLTMLVELGSQSQKSKQSANGI